MSSVLCLRVSACAAAQALSDPCWDHSRRSPLSPFTLTLAPSWNVQGCFQPLDLHVLPFDLNGDVGTLTTDPPKFPGNDPFDLVQSHIINAGEIPDHFIFCLIGEPPELGVVGFCVPIITGAEECGGEEGEKLIMRDGRGFGQAEDRLIDRRCIEVSKPNQRG
ncbi:hypothetical protein [uncultured Tateyamaria sp.]|uniref:hypothetical protein n=1 Tax=uncultured Tateyamaria sp. TaxID=455651 RepID=UPI0026125DE0|nr:hypothetical protein [uncultured Tateyamaria sp.]